MGSPHAGGGLVRTKLFSPRTMSLSLWRPFQRGLSVSPTRHVSTEQIPQGRFRWDKFDRTCLAFVDNPLQQLVLIRTKFVNRDGSRPVRASDQHWHFTPGTALRSELNRLRECSTMRFFPNIEHKYLLEKQKLLEHSAYADALHRYNKLNDGFVERGQIEHHSRLQQQMRKWHKPLTLAIRQEQMDVQRHLPSIDRQSYGPYILLLDAEILAVITLHEVSGMRPVARTAG